MSMSDKVDKNLISSSAACELSNSNTVNKMYTPCRRVGLKRKSVSSPIHSNISKKKNLFGHEANENISNESSLVLNAEKQDKSILKIKSTEDFMQDNIKDKQRKIEELKTELKNSEQVRKSFYIRILHSTYHVFQINLKKLAIDSQVDLLCSF